LHKQLGEVQSPLASSSISSVENLNTMGSPRLRKHTSGVATTRSPSIGATVKSCHTHDGAPIGTSSTMTMPVTVLLYPPELPPSEKQKMHLNVLQTDAPHHCGLASELHPFHRTQPTSTWKDGPSNTDHIGASAVVGTSLVSTPLLRSKQWSSSSTGKGVVSTPPPGIRRASTSPIADV
jgi:hypothetical protein